MPAPTGPWGWHQLDTRWADRLVRYACVEAGDLVLDVGAGTGAITSLLVDAGARVIAVELHPDRAAILRRRFAGAAVKVVRADGADLRLPARPFKVVANPPFGITTALLRRLTGPRSQLQRGALVVPSWAAMRWAAGRGVGGIVSRRTYAIAVGDRVPLRAFHPSPPVLPSIIVITRRSR